MNFPKRSVVMALMEVRACKVYIMYNKYMNYDKR